MFAGHVGAALAIGRIERRVNVGVFIIAALLLDSVLWLLVLIGWESVSIPQDFGVAHQPEYLFPYSHGLVASIGWSLVAAAAALLWSTRVPRAGWRIASLLALAVFSHWLLDAVVHQPELSIAGANSAKVGLGLWDSMSVALAVEAAIVLAGLWLFVAGATLSRGKRYAIIVLTLII